MTKPIATVELDKPLEWVDGKAELPLPEGKGWKLPEVSWSVTAHDDGTILLWPAADASGKWPEDWEEVPLDVRIGSIIEVRYPDGTSELVRVVDVLGVEWVEGEYGPSAARLWGKVPHLRCVVVPA